KWCKSVEHTTQIYIDLMFAFALARLGEVNACRERIQKAEAWIAAKRKGKQPWPDGPRLVTEFLFDAFRYRIDQSLQGRPHTGPLSPELRERLEKEIPSSDGMSTIRYGVDRMMRISQIVEPEEKYDPYWNHNKKHLSELQQELLALKPVHDATL